MARLPQLKGAMQSKYYLTMCLISHSNLIDEVKTLESFLMLLSKLVNCNAIYIFASMCHFIAAQDSILM